jgi:sensor histidine kinase YesM
MIKAHIYSRLTTVLTPLINLLPLLAAIMLAAQIRYWELNANSISHYLTINGQLIIECLPFFISLAIALKQPIIKASLCWAVGFIAYPIILYVMNEHELFNQWSYLDPQGWLLCTISSACWLVIDKTNRHTEVLTRYWLQTLLSLDSLVLIALIIWASLFAGVLNSHVDPMLNQPFNFILDLYLIVAQFSQFFSYFWQMIIIGLLIYLVYWVNRYLLIRQLLTHHGVVAFLFASTMTLLLLTPALIWLILQLPINQLPEHVSNLTPSGNNDIFSPQNYQFSTLFIAISTPIILAFERQAQHAQLIEITQQQTQTELKLLQQQINPHFLFNTLNNLYALTLTKSESAPELVIQLANLLRYSVYFGDKPMVNLAKEIGYLQNFITLQAIRSGEKCEFITAWPTNAEQFTIPPLLLINLLENAIKHGVEPARNPVKVSFKLSIEQNTLTVYCKNPLHSDQPTAQGGFGLRNLNKRLTLLFPKKHRLIHHQDNNEWFSTLTLELNRC